ncbi:MAG: hypothetical protein COA71_09570 [SAR86 cluster bacterium]|uniref:Flagellar biosynthesis protein FlaG n=1 Tax=SAR86 cluster bacterium TaxID=2030880 RepID=A0A2A5CAL5_9GAMM|nr:MAG: hypothetical protein COA71_09570 [SAR86 cluster bacterium]
MTTLEKINVSAKRELSVSQIKATNDNEKRQSVAVGGKPLPGSGSSSSLAETKKQELNQAVKEVSGYVQNITRELNFTIDEELDRFVVTVIDRETGEVVRQIPSEDMLEIAKTLSDAQERESKGVLRGVLFQADV